MSRLTALWCRYFPPKVLPPQHFLSLTEDAKIRSILESLPRNGIFVDLGANIGNVTAVALEYGHHLFAFEPDPFAVVLLSQRFGTNPSVTIMPKAIGSSSRIERFYRRKDVEEGAASQASSFIPRDEHAGGKMIEVEVVGIDAFLKELSSPPIVMKVDIEGAEAELLEALIDSGAHTRIGMILVETHDRFSPELASRLDRIRGRIADQRITNIDLSWT